MLRNDTCRCLFNLYTYVHSYTCARACTHARALAKLKHRLRPKPCQASFLIAGPLHVPYFTGGSGRTRSHYLGPGLQGSQSNLTHPSQSRKPAVRVKPRPTTRTTVLPPALGMACEQAPHCPPKTLLSSLSICQTQTAQNPLLNENRWQSALRERKGEREASQEAVTDQRNKAPHLTQLLCLPNLPTTTTTTPQCQPSFQPGPQTSSLGVTIPRGPAAEQKLTRKPLGCTLSSAACSW